MPKGYLARSANLPEGLYIFLDQVEKENWS